jgi:hypothetical protein
MKNLIKFVLVLLVLIVGGAAAVYIYLDQIAKTGIERGSRYALGVETTLDSADVQIFRGQLVLRKFHVANPNDFESDHFLNLKGGDVQVTLGSLRQPVVHVPHLKLSGVDVSLEKRAGASNYQVILDNLKRLQGDPNQPGKRFIIDRLVIRDVHVRADVLGNLPGGELAKVSVPIDEVRLKRVGAENQRGVTISELSALIVKAVLASAVEKGAGLIPADIQEELRGKLSELADLDKLLEGVDLGELQKKAEELGLPKDATEKAKEEIEKQVGGVKDLLGDNKK